MHSNPATHAAAQQWSDLDGWTCVEVPTDVVHKKTGVGSRTIIQSNLFRICPKRRHSCQAGPYRMERVCRSNYLCKLTVVLMTRVSLNASSLQGGGDYLHSKIMFTSCIILRKEINNRKIHLVFKLHQASRTSAILSTYSVRTPVVMLFLSAGSLLLVSSAAVSPCTPPAGLSCAA